MALASPSIRAQRDVRAEPRAERLYFFDNLRVVLTCAVITHHVGQAFGPTGGFWPIQDATRADILGPFFAVNRSFGMSLFFLIAGYFMVRSYDAHGPRAFIRSRLTRLGIPLLVFMLIAMPVMIIIGGPPENSSFLGLPELNALHMWFVEHLLIYSLCYAGVRVAAARGWLPVIKEGAGVPRARSIAIFALGLALVTAVVRTWFPIDYWLNLFGFIRVAFADVPRDLSFFIIGALAYRHNWLARFSSRAGYAWLATGLVLAAVWYVYDLSAAESVTLSVQAQGLLYAVWESLLCCGMCIGLVVVFRDKLNAQTAFTAELGRSQYLTYVIHIILVLGMQAAVLALPVSPFVKFVLATLAAIPLSFLVSSLLRRPLRI